MSESNKNRRDFIKQSATAVASMAAFPSVASAESSSLANAKIRIGFVGPGGRGFRAHVRTLCKLQGEGQPIELVAVCDVYNKHRERAANYIEQETGQKPAQLIDYLEMIEKSNLDAVCIGNDYPQQNCTYTATQLLGF